MIDINVLVWIAIIVLMLISKILADMYIDMERGWYNAKKKRSTKVDACDRI